jgi:hypothetical protein
MSIGEIDGTLVDSDGAEVSATAYVPLMWTQTTAAHFQAGTASGTDRSSSPGNVILGTSRLDASVFAAVGGTSQAFYRYNTVSNSWTQVASLPFEHGAL